MFTIISYIIIIWKLQMDNIKKAYVDSRFRTRDSISDNVFS